MGTPTYRCLRLNVAYFLRPQFLMGTKSVAFAPAVYDLDEHFGACQPVEGFSLKQYKLTEYCFVFKISFQIRTTTLQDVKIGSGKSNDILPSRKLIDYQETAVVRALVRSNQYLSPAEKCKPHTCVK